MYGWYTLIYVTLSQSSSTVTTSPRYFRNTYRGQCAQWFVDLEAAQAELPWAGPTEHHLGVFRRAFWWDSRTTAANTAVRDVLKSILTVLYDTPWHARHGSIAGRS